MTHRKLSDVELRQAYDQAVDMVILQGHELEQVNKRTDANNHLMG